ncbi:MAG: hypothetical protein DRG78_04430 [Epsilonproteobacteria bacterium]|nr:MAG: hypothetical protein DRG78_04430 [Campylobacterota bacterium]
MISINENFWSNVEKDLKYVLYTDTDSLFLNVPKLVPKSPEQALEFADMLGVEINAVIEDFTINGILAKLGIGADQNQTFYKTELVADSILFVDVKKNYAYTELAHKGKINSEPRIEYTGIPVVKSNFSKLSQNIIKELVENIGLSKNVTSAAQVKSAINDLGQEFVGRINELSDKGELTEVGVPCKWGSGSYKSEPAAVIAMRLYNTIFNVELFRPMGSALHVPIIVHNPKLLETYINPIKETSMFYLNKIPTTNLTYLAVPYDHDPEVIKAKLAELHIEIDKVKLWEIVYGKTAQRIVNTIKTSYKIK